MVTNVRDPRSIITPDAFVLDRSLLGLPLAAPSRRFWALLIDLVVIGLLTAVTASVALFVWGAVALFLISMAFRDPGERLGQFTGWLFRGATGCLGSMVLVGVLIGFLATRGGPDTDDLPEMDDVDIPDVPGLTGLDVGGATSTGDATLRDVIQGISGAAALREAEDSAEARVALQDLLSSMSRAGLGRTELEEAASGFRELAPADAAWRSELPTIERRALDAIAPVGEASDPADDVVVSPGLVAEIAGLSDGDVLRAYAEVVEDTTADGDRTRLLRARALPLLAADTLEALASALEDAADEREDLLEDLEDAREELEAEEGGFGDLLRDIWDQLGSAIGLWSVYFTVALTLTRGRTVGKKMLGLRVLRLDGQPITWWFAFERAGGYVAGIATGLLGFAQVFWDPNRQCVHDKIGGTVVVVDGAEPIPGAWQEAWRQQQAEREARP